MSVAPKTPEAVAHDLARHHPCRCAEESVPDEVRCIWSCADYANAIIAALHQRDREARAAAIEEAVRELEAFGDPDYYAEAIVAIRALGEEGAG